jgi:glycerol uptake facilitator-like aquaporin
MLLAHMRNYSNQGKLVTEIITTILLVTLVTKVTMVKLGTKSHKMYIGLHVTYLLLLSNFNQNYKTPTNFSKNPQYHVIPCGHTDRYE